jgi:hypothetical protein
MIRSTIRFEVLYGHYNDALEICDEIDKLAQAKNLPPSRMMLPVAGKANVLIAESEYESLAVYEKDSETFYGDPDIMKQVRRLSAVTVQGSTVIDLTTEPPRLA